MRIKSIILKLFISIFIVFIKIHNLLSQIIILALPTTLCDFCVTKELLKTYLQVISPQRVKIFYLFQIIANCSISLMLSYSIINFNDRFIDIILTVCHNVHFWFISSIIDIPDFSDILSDSRIFKLIFCYIYLFFCYIGFSYQIFLTIDLIYVLNLPTIFIYRFLSYCYKFLISHVYLLWKILTYDSQNWITCKINKIWLNQSMKQVYRGLIIIEIIFLAMVSFYYLWLAFVISALKILMNMFYNLAIIMNQMGAILAVLKGMDLQHISRPQLGSNFYQKIQITVKHFKNTQFISLINLQNIIDIFQGKDIFQSKQRLTRKKNIILSFKRIFDIFYKQISQQLI